jgi:hypothetical protein
MRPPAITQCEQDSAMKSSMAADDVEQLQLPWGRDGVIAMTAIEGSPHDLYKTAR